MRKSYKKRPQPLRPVTQPQNASRCHPLCSKACRWFRCIPAGASGCRQVQPRKQRLVPVIAMRARSIYRRANKSALSSGITGLKGCRPEWEGGHYVSATLQGSSHGVQSQQRDRVTDEQAIIVKVTGGAITPTVTGAGVFPDNAQVF